MLDTLQPQSITSYINEIRKPDPVNKSTMIIPVKTQIKAMTSKKEEPVALPDLPFEKWNLPRQPQGYIECNKYNFL
jgi:hypothetical protein